MSDLDEAAILELEEQAMLGQGDLECEYSFSGEAGLLKNKERCRKHGKSRHEGFHQMSSLSLEQFPTECRSENILQLIRSCADLTVRITVQEISQHRPEMFPDKRYGKYPWHATKNQFVRTGSGFIMKASFHNTACLCTDCKSSTSPRQEWAAFVVRTATHVVFDVHELRHTQVDLFYDVDDGTNEERVTLCPVMERDSELPSDSNFYVDSDIARFVCITHDIEMAKKLSESVRVYENMLVAEELFNCEERHPCIVISHPHGCGKRVTFGNVQEVGIMHPEGFDTELSDNIYLLEYDSHTCPGSSGAVVLWKRFNFVHSGSVNRGHGGKLSNRSARSHAFMQTPRNVKVTVEVLTKEQYKDLYKSNTNQRLIDSIKASLSFLLKMIENTEDTQTLYATLDAFWSQLQGKLCTLVVASSSQEKDQIVQARMKRIWVDMREEYFHILRRKDTTEKQRLLDLMETTWNHTRRKLMQARAEVDPQDKLTLYDWMDDLVEWSKLVSVLSESGMGVLMLASFNDDQSTHCA